MPSAASLPQGGRGALWHQEGGRGSGAGGRRAREGGTQEGGAAAQANQEGPRTARPLGLPLALVHQQGQARAWVWVGERRGAAAGAGRTGSWADAGPHAASSQGSRRGVRRLLRRDVLPSSAPAVFQAPGVTHLPGDQRALGTAGGQDAGAERQHRLFRGGVTGGGSGRARAGTRGRSGSRP